MFLYLYLSFYYTEVVLLPAAAVAAIFLAARIWDAVNNPMIGAIADRSRRKNGKFLPWIRLSTCLLPASCILVFLIRPAWSAGAKIAYAAVTYILFGMIYTVNDAPAFALSTAMTDDVVGLAGAAVIISAAGLNASVPVAAQKPGSLEGKYGNPYGAE